MEQKTTARDRIVVEAPTGKTVFVDGVETHPRYGPKTVLGGDTYELLSRNGEGLANELDFHEHHLSWDGDFFEAWTMDVGDEHTEALREVVEAAGHSFGGVGAEVARELVDAVDPDEFDWWSSHGIEVRVFYESKQSGREMSKAGTVSSVDLNGGAFSLKREDGKVNTVRGGSMYSQSSRYPYMGDVTRVEVDL
jgi:hypothetical protein